MPSRAPGVPPAVPGRLRDLALGSEIPLAQLEQRFVAALRHDLDGLFDVLGGMLGHDLHAEPRRAFADGGVLDKIGEQLSGLHATIKLAFEATITDHARVVWA